MGRRRDSCAAGELPSVKCSLCGKPTVGNRTQCSACRSKKYRSTPRGRERSAEAARKWREKHCDSEYLKRIYARQTPERKAAVREARRRLRARNREMSDTAKSVPCLDCGLTFPPVCMDFDHVRGEKRGDIATMVGNCRSRKMLQEEIAKCEIVCACCHRLRTARRNLQHDE